MTTYTRPPMHLELVVCPMSGFGHTCGKTVAATVGTPLDRLTHPAWFVILVLALRASGVPIPAIVFAVGLDERTVADWHGKAGAHAKAIQEQVVCHGSVAVGQVQGDELSVKAQRSKARWRQPCASVRACSSGGGWQRARPDLGGAGGGESARCRARGPPDRVGHRWLCMLAKLGLARLS